MNGSRQTDYILGVTEGGIKISIQAGCNYALFSALDYETIQLTKDKLEGLRDIIDDAIEDLEDIESFGL